MARQVLLVSALLLFLNFSLVICRNDYYQYFTNQLSHHHRKSTPDDSASSTEAAVSLTAEASSSGLPSNAAVNNSGEHRDHHHHSSQYDTSYDAMESAYSAVLILSIGSIVVCLLFLLIGLIILFCCVRDMGRTVRQGYVLTNTSGNLTGGQPQQQVFAISQQMTHNPQGEELPPPYSVHTKQQHEFPDTNQEI